MSLYAKIILRIIEAGFRPNKQTRRRRLRRLRSRLIIGLIRRRLQINTGE
jgi:hypothetical protein